MWHAYVDESGDRGWKPRPANTPLGTRAGSSQHFDMTAVIVPDGSQTPILDRWSDAAEEIGRDRLDPIHWVNVRNHAQRLHLSAVVGAFPQLLVCSVVFSKWDVKNVRAVTRPEYLYNWTLRLLVERLSWFARSMTDTLVMHFAEVSGLSPSVIGAYLSKLQMIDTQIDWRWLVLPAKVNTPINQRMLQVADTASGAVHTAFEWDDYGSVEGHYLANIRPRIWRPPGGAMHKYGLKVSPWPHPRHAWLADFCRST
jgi:hypothetical protein